MDIKRSVFYLFTKLSKLLRNDLFGGGLPSYVPNFTEDNFARLGTTFSRANAIDFPLLR